MINMRTLKYPLSTLTTTINIFQVKMLLAHLLLVIQSVITHADEVINLPVRYKKIDDTSSIPASFCAHYLLLNIEAEKTKAALQQVEGKICQNLKKHTDILKTHIQKQVKQITVECKNPRVKEVYFMSSTIKIDLPGITTINAFQAKFFKAVPVHFNATLICPTVHDKNVKVRLGYTENCYIDFAYCLSKIEDNRDYFIWMVGLTTLLLVFAWVHTKQANTKKKTSLSSAFRTQMSQSNQERENAYKRDQAISAFLRITLKDALAKEFKAVEILYRKDTLTKDKYSGYLGFRFSRQIKKDGIQHQVCRQTLLTYGFKLTTLTRSQKGYQYTISYEGTIDSLPKQNNLITKIQAIHDELKRQPKAIKSSVSDPQGLRLR